MRRGLQLGCGQRRRGQQQLARRGLQLGGCGQRRRGQQQLARRERIVQSGSWTHTLDFARRWFSRRGRDGLERRQRWSRRYVVFPPLSRTLVVEVDRDGVDKFYQSESWSRRYVVYPPSAEPGSSRLTEMELVGPMVSK